MAYDFGGADFGASTAKRGLSAEDADPRVGLVNLADVFLVFACGLMLALVSYWNLDLPNVLELKSQDMQELNDVEQMVQQAQSANAYIEKGTVYQDPNTGKLYWMIETDEAGNPIQSDGSAVPDGGTGTPTAAPSLSAPSRAQGAD